MGLCTVEPKNHSAMLARLTEVERIKIRNATYDELEYMRVNQLAADGPPSFETMVEVQRTLNTVFKASTVARQMGRE